LIEPVAGTRRNRLTLTGAYYIRGRGKKTYVEYEVRCKCGEFFFVRSNSFRGGHTKSCGCLKREMAPKVAKENRTTHGMSGTREYDAYMHAKNRCTNPKDINYENYGGRGIKFLFKTFEDFYDELGKRPQGKTLDRIDNNGDYVVGNVQWSNKSQQMKNRRPFSRCKSW
jgi:hypothetical protein